METAAHNVVGFKWIVPQENLLAIESYFDLKNNNIRMQGGDYFFTVLSRLPSNEQFSDIVINCLPNANERISVSKTFLESLKRSQVEFIIKELELGLIKIGKLHNFISDIRKLCNYCIKRFPDEISFKYKYSTIGGGQYMDKQSISYLQECAKQYELNHYEGLAGVSLYLLAQNENDEDTKIGILRRAISLFELEYLSGFDSENCFYEEHIMALIEFADLENIRRKRIESVLKVKNQNYISHYVPCKNPYDKAINMIKSFIKRSFKDIDALDKEERNIKESLIYGYVLKFENRFRHSQYALEYCGIVLEYYNECAIFLKKCLGN